MCRTSRYCNGGAKDKRVMGMLHMALHCLLSKGAAHSVDMGVYGAARNALVGTASHTEEIKAEQRDRYRTLVGGSVNCNR